jgi:hypothetical protein
MSGCWELGRTGELGSREAGMSGGWDVGRLRCQDVGSVGGWEGGRLDLPALLLLPRACLPHPSFVPHERLQNVGAVPRVPSELDVVGRIHNHQAANTCCPVLVSPEITSSTTLTTFVQSQSSGPFPRRCHGRRCILGTPPSTRRKGGRELGGRELGRTGARKDGSSEDGSSEDGSSEDGSSGACEDGSSENVSSAKGRTGPWDDGRT